MLRSNIKGGHTEVHEANTLVVRRLAGEPNTLRELGQCESALDAASAFPG